MVSIGQNVKTENLHVTRRIKVLFTSSTLAKNVILAELTYLG